MFRLPGLRYYPSCPEHARAQVAQGGHLRFASLVLGDGKRCHKRWSRSARALHTCDETGEWIAIETIMQDLNLSRREHM
jgi:hypothetical protein